MVYAIIALAGLMIGLYAGKRRQEGRPWVGVVSDLATDSFKFCALVFEKMSYPFRKGKKQPEDDE